MYDLFDLFGPRVYVVSEKHYEEALKKRKEAERKDLEERRERLLARVAEIDEALEKLVD